MLYYRRKVLLALLEAFDNKLSKIDLQKLLFLFCKKQADNQAFHFLPHQYGCYSYQSNYDLGALCLNGLVAEEAKHWQKKDTVSYHNMLTDKDKTILSFIKSNYKDMTTDDLIRTTYTAYPFYAIHSKVYKEKLDTEGIAAVEAAKIHTTDKGLYTIGYEGISVEQYFERLIKADVKVLCDVRKNPLSQKYGFSKGILQNICAAMNIEYLHLSMLGIESNKRQNLHTSQDRVLLFENYAACTLPNTGAAVQTIIEKIETHQRVALTCFEAQQCDCHRGTLAKHIATLPNFNYAIHHL